MKKKIFNILTKKSIAVLIIASVIMLLLAFTGCGSSKDADELQTSAAPTAGAKATPSATRASTNSSPKNTTKAAPTTSPRALPKLTDISFTLALDAQQEYSEYPSPIYLKTTQALHLSWVVVKGGDHFYMTFTLPSGKLIGVRSNGSLTGLVAGQLPTEPLTKSGDLVLRPDDNDWQEGYFLFHPQIHKGDSNIAVKLLYWIEG
jgi:hypothetical protein